MIEHTISPDKPIRTIRTVGAAPGPRVRRQEHRHQRRIVRSILLSLWQAREIDAGTAARMIAMRDAEERLDALRAARGRVAGSDLPVSRDLLGGGHSWTLTEWEARWEDEENAAAIREQAAPVVLRGVLHRQRAIPCADRHGQEALELLELTPDVDFAAIKAAYRAKAKLVHPDLHPGDADAAKAFQALQLAYEILRQAEERREWMG